MTPPERKSEWKKYLGMFNDPTIVILLVAAGLSVLVTCAGKYMLNGEGSFIDPLGILIAVFLATTVAYLNEKKSEREFEILNQVKEDIDIKVTRDGEYNKISINDIVVGDLIHISLGDKVPSDGYIVASLSLIVDESMLTGESEPSEKMVAPDRSGKMPSTISKDYVYRGTMVVDGHGSYITAAVGDRTRMGCIAQNLEVEEEDTPLKQKLTVLADQISMAGTVAATLIFTAMSTIRLYNSRLFGMLCGEVSLLILFVLTSSVLSILMMKMVFKMEVKSFKSLSFIPLTLGVFIAMAVIWGFWHEPPLAIDLLNSLLLSFVVAVTIIVVAVPEGLPMMVNVSLALNMRKMAKENCLIRKLVASETIGSATVVCTDKTGTLTQNKMQPVWLYLGMNSFDVITKNGNIKSDEWDRLIRNIAINSNANLIKTADGYKAGGNATECALLELLRKHDVDYLDLRDMHRCVHQIDYNSARKLSIAMIQEDGTTCFIKGAPEIVLTKCNFISIDGKLEPIAGHMAEITRVLNDATGAKALRVIAFSEKLPGACDTITETNCLECGDRVFLGFVGIADPLRPEAANAVALCKQAGIKVKMVTGDDPRTAAAIARQCGILTEDDALMVSVDFQQASDEHLLSRIDQIQVLARSTPEDKLRLVKLLHMRNEVVAVTGDGTNDAPALKAADVGLSMGICGTEVAKEASDIVLVDDNFNSIVTGVKWGRGLFDNIQRFLQFQLSVNVVALLCALIGPMIGYPLPLTVPQLLWINIIMDTFAALALSTDPIRPNIMNRKPIARDSHIITPFMSVSIGISSIFQVLVLLAVLKFNLFNATSTLEELTIFFTVFVMFQFWHKFNCRSLSYKESPFYLISKNINFIIIVVVITIVQVIMVQVGGPVGEIFRTIPLPTNTWVWIFILTASILPIGWLARYTAHMLTARNAVA